MNIVNDCIVYIIVMIIMLALIYCYRKIIQSEVIHAWEYKEGQRKI